MGVESTLLHNYVHISTCSDISEYVPLEVSETFLNWVFQGAVNDCMRDLRSDLID